MRFLIPAIILSLVILACEGSTEEGEGTGQLEIILADAPFPITEVEAANVIIDSIQIQVPGGEGESFSTILDSTQQFNLLELSNGVTALLGNATLATGSYSQVRMFVASAEVVMVVGNPFDLKVPSGSSSGIKIKIQPAIAILDGQTSSILLDFDVSRSFVMKGSSNNITGFNFKPVIRAQNLAVSGNLSGNVSGTAAVAIAGAEVWVETDSTITSAITDTTGYYAIIGLSPDSYTLKAVATGYDTTTVAGVTIQAGTNSTQDITLTE
ncbi:MAG: DUF4382 domain-containing protein [Candidatus Neomarinimicrobiota bacterium]